MSFPCTYFCGFSNLNYDIETLQKLREGEAVFLNFAEKVWNIQRERGDHALIENPLTSAVWRTPQMQRTCQQPGAVEVLFDGCRFQFRCATTGKLVKKGLKMIGTHLAFAKRLGRRCSKQHRHDYEHVAIEGSRTKQSQQYTRQLADAVLASLREIIAEEDFGSSAGVFLADLPGDYRPHAASLEVFATDVNIDEQTWRRVLEQAQGLAEQRSTNNHNCALESRLGRLIATLVPWSIRLIQVTRTPKAKRWDLRHPDTHRLTVAIAADDTIVVQPERMIDSLGSRQRFSKPQRLAIFIFGVSRQTREQDSAPPAVAPSISHHGTEVWFEGGPQDKGLRAVMVRLHNNLGHPDTPTMVRMLFQADARDEAVLLAKALRCGACIRAKGTHLARPSRVPRVGSFNTHAGIDIFFLRDAKKETWMYLSIVELSAMYHVSSLVANRSSGHLWERFRAMWLNWAGPPRVLFLDPDRGFMGEFKENCLLFDIDLRPCSAEAHYQIGRLERAQGTWKSLAMKTIDAGQLCGKSDMENLAVQITRTRRAGFSPC